MSEKPTGVILADRLLTERERAELSQAVREYDGSMPLAEYIEKRLSISIEYINFEGKTMTEQELIEQLAEKEHASWSHWMDYLFSKCTNTVKGDTVIPVDLSLRWRRQASTPYEQLTEREKQSDRDEVMHILPIIKEYYS